MQTQSMISPVLFELDMNPLKTKPPKKPKLTLQLKNMQCPDIIPSPSTARHISCPSITSNIIKVNNQLYFGGQPTQNDLKTLKKTNISIIVNLAAGKLPNTFEDHFKYENYMIEDTFDQDFEANLANIILNINNHIKSGKVVYVHCRKGISRAPCIIIAYLMVYQNHGYQQSMNCIRELKPTIDLNIWFIQVLQKVGREFQLE